MCFLFFLYKLYNILNNKKRLNQIYNMIHACLQKKVNLPIKCICCYLKNQIFLCIK